jgi:hypothetical protein
MTIDLSPTSGRAEVDAALLLLSRLGVTPEDLIAGAAGVRKQVPTFADYVPQVAAATSPGTLKAYGSYWNKVVEHWGSRQLTEPSPLEIQQLGKQLRAARTIRRNGRGGASAEENYVAAMRCLYRRAVADGFLSDAENPAAKVTKPRRQPNTRRAMPDARLVGGMELSEQVPLDEVLLMGLDVGRLHLWVFVGLRYAQNMSLLILSCQRVWFACEGSHGSRHFIDLGLDVGGGGTDLAGVFAMPGEGASDRIADGAFDPRDDRVSQPVRGDALGGDPGQVLADALPEVVVPAVGDRSAVVVPQQLRGAGRIAVATLVPVRQQRPHQGRRDRLPALGAALLMQPDQALLRVQVTSARPTPRCRNPSARAHFDEASSEVHSRSPVRSSPHL